MAIQNSFIEVLSPTFVMPLLLAVEAKEETYFKGLNTAADAVGVNSYPDSEAIQRRAPLANAQGVGQSTLVGVPPTTLGIAYELYTPTPVNFTFAGTLPVIPGYTGTGPLALPQAAVDNQVQVLAAGAAKNANRPLVLSATGLALNATDVSGALTTVVCPYLDVAVELLQKETNPYFRFGLEDMKVDIRLINAANTVCKDVIVGQPIMQYSSPTINHPGVGRYVIYRFLRPFKKATVSTDILQIRVAYPAIGNSVLTQTPTGIFRAIVSGPFAVTA